MHPLFTYNEVTVPGSLRQITYPARECKLPHLELRLGFQAMSCSVVNPVELTRLSHESHGATLYVLQVCGMQSSVPAAGKSVQECWELIGI